MTAEQKEVCLAKIGEGTQLLFGRINKHIDGANNPEDLEDMLIISSSLLLLVCTLLLKGSDTPEEIVLRFLEGT